MTLPTDASCGTVDDPTLLGRDLGFALGVVLRSYIKAASLVVSDLPGGSRGYQVISAATCGAAESQRSLAQRLGVDRTVMTYLLDDLEQEGLVTRRPDPADRRNRHVLPTPEGSRRCSDLRNRLQQVEDQVLAPLSPAEQATLRELLCRLAGHALASDPARAACVEAATGSPTTGSGAEPAPGAATVPARPRRPGRR